MIRKSYQPYPKKDYMSGLIITTIARTRCEKFMGSRLRFNELSTFVSFTWSKIISIEEYIEPNKHCDDILVFRSYPTRIIMFPKRRFSAYGTKKRELLTIT